MRFEFGNDYNMYSCRLRVSLIYMRVRKGVNNFGGLVLVVLLDGKYIPLKGCYRGI